MSCTQPHLCCFYDQVQGLPALAASQEHHRSIVEQAGRDGSLGWLWSIPVFLGPLTGCGLQLLVQLQAFLVGLQGSCTGMRHSLSEQAGGRWLCLLQYGSDCLTFTLFWLLFITHSLTVALCHT